MAYNKEHRPRFSFKYFTKCLNPIKRRPSGLNKDFFSSLPVSDFCPVDSGYWSTYSNESFRAHNVLSTTLTSKARHTQVHNLVQNHCSWKKKKKKKKKNREKEEKRPKKTPNNFPRLAQTLTARNLWCSPAPQQLSRLDSLSLSLSLLVQHYGADWEAKT